MEIEKVFKAKKGLLITAIILMLIAIGMFTYVVWKEETAVTPEPVKYYELATNNSEKEHTYVTVNIVYMSSFAKKEDYNLTYYYIMDENGVIYIARISDTTVEKIMKLYNEQQENFSYELKGYIFNIDSDVKKIAIEEFSNAFKDAPLVTEENYEQYLGKTYLNEWVTPDTELYGIMVGVSFGIGILAIIFGIIYIIGVIKIHKYTKASYFEDLKYELEKSTCKHFEKENIFLTDNYIVSNIGGLLKVSKYEDLIWIYECDQTVNGVNFKGITARIKNKKQFNIAGSAFLSKENKLNEILCIIKEKNPNILVGFTPENEKEFKNICKGI